MPPWLHHCVIFWPQGNVETVDNSIATSTMEQILRQWFQCSIMAQAQRISEFLEFTKAREISKMESITVPNLIFFLIMVLTLETWKYYNQASFSCLTLQWYSSSPKFVITKSQNVASSRVSFTPYPRISYIAIFLYQQKRLEKIESFCS